MKLVPFLALLFSAFLFGQDVNIVPRDGIKTKAPVPQFEFRIGLSRDAVVAALGEPKQWIAAGRHWDSYPQILDRSLIWEVYERKTESNEYEVAVDYAIDDGESRLHPKRVIEEVRFTLDQHRNVKETINDVAEFRTLCSATCSVIGRGDNVSREVLLFPPGASGDVSPSAIIQLTQASGADWLHSDVRYATLSTVGPRLALATRRGVGLGDWRP